MNWPQVPLGYCVSEVRRKNHGGQEHNLLSLSYGNIVRRDITSNEGLLPESFDTYNIVDSGDTGLRLTDLQNDQRSLRVGLVQERGIITSAYVSIRPGHQVDSRYLNYFLKHLDFRKEFYALGAGVRQSLRFDELKGIRVPVPPMASQRAIADYLDVESARSEALIRLLNVTSQQSIRWYLAGSVPNISPVPVEDQRSASAELRTSSDLIETLSLRLQTQLELVREHRQAQVTAAVMGELDIPGVTS